MKHIRAVLLFVMSLLLVATPALALGGTASAATPVPSIASATPLPTVQIDGIVWAQVTVGNTVYATGRFQNARPAGAPAGTNQTPRANLLAYDIRTGALISSFNHTLTGANAEGRAIAASPDGTRLYVGGKFSAVDGQARNNFVGINLTNNTLTPLSAGPNNTVRSIAATNDWVYLGGIFTAVGGQTRNRLAAYNSAGTLISWAPSVTVTGGPAGAAVTAMVTSPRTGALIIGGYFNRINDSVYYSSGAVSLANGAPLPWASQSASYAIKDQLRPEAYGADSTQITSLAIDPDGLQAYLTSYSTAGPRGDNSFEGRAAINPANGDIIWLNDCRGDSYGVFPIGQVLYSTGHAHDCTAIGAFQESSPRVSRRVLAETTYATGVNGAGFDTSGYYTSYVGWARSSQYNWYPSLTPANVSGSSQAAWSVTGNQQFVAFGGEFPSVQGVQQQGLVRFAINPQSATNLRSANGGRCLGAVGSGNGQNGTGVTIWDCVGSKDQQWTVSQDGLIRLSANGNRCLGADGAGNGQNGTGLTLWDCVGSSNQQWTLRSNGTIALANGGRCLSMVGSGGGQNGTGLHLWDCGNSADQRWMTL